MKSANPQFGLVLTGGGAKGAYQVGALKYLSEIGFEPHIIAGSSIGALNSAILAAYRPFPQAIHQLDDLWTRLAEIHPLKVNMLTGSRFAMQFIAPSVAPGLDFAYGCFLNFMSAWQILPNSRALLDISPIESYVRQTIHPDNLRKGIELWVTAFPCLKFFGIEFGPMLEIVRARMGSETHWLCVNEFKDDEAIWNILLASAALPWVFPRRRVAGVTYMDGGLADNIPLKPLADRGCNYVIVIHLQNGSIWDQTKFPDQTIIEIRPQQVINKSGAPVVGIVNTFFDFSAERIASLKHRGYEDAKQAMEPILTTLRSVRQNRQGIESLINSTDSLLSSTRQLLEDQPLI